MTTDPLSCRTMHRPALAGVRYRKNRTPRFAWALLVVALGISSQAQAAVTKLQCDDLVPRYATPAQALEQRRSGAPAALPTQPSPAPAHLPFAAPLDTIRLTSTFGARVHPLNKTSHVHSGIDLAAPTGTPVMAAAAGTVEFVGADPFYGNYIVLRHGDHRQTYYGHLSAFEHGLAVGQSVQQGQLIGKVGSTGQSTGPHLHFEIREQRQPVDPLMLTAGVAPTRAKNMTAPRTPQARAVQAKHAPSLAALLGDKRTYSCASS